MIGPIIITAPEFFAREAYYINQLFSHGLSTLHLRKPKASECECRKLIEQISQEHHPQIVIHQHHELASKYHLRGIHLTAKTRGERQFSANSKIISSSFHRMEDMLNNAIPFDYGFFSPVMPSISKTGYTPSVSHETIKRFLKKNKSGINFKIVALGGITATNFQQTVDLGFDGVAFLGTIWQSHTPLKIWKKIKGMESTHQAVFHPLF